MSHILEMRNVCLALLPPAVAKKYKETEQDYYFLTLALCGEVGELANLMKKMWRGDPIKVEDIADELADIRVYLELLAKHFDLEGKKLDVRVGIKLEKIVERYKTKPVTL